jgi:hypothetical protein
MFPALSAPYAAAMLTQRLREAELARTAAAARAASRRARRTQSFLAPRNGAYRPMFRMSGLRPILRPVRRQR